MAISAATANETPKTRQTAPRNRRRATEAPPEPLLVTHEQDAVALRHGLDDLAGEAKDGSLVRRAVTDDESARTVGEPIEHPAQRRSQDGGVLVDELRICRT